VQRHSPNVGRRRRVRRAAFQSRNAPAQLADVDVDVDLALALPLTHFFPFF
jgi:hypothetical protein